MKAKNLGIIADDLTGALDTGVQFSKWGLTSLVALSDAPLPGVACVVVDTDSRAAPPEVAEERVRLATRRLGGRLVYKKIDSTLRGNVGLEIVAAMQELRVDKAVVAPAFPANGRTTIGGRLLVRGVPLHQTGLARDPRNAITESHIPTLLQGQIARAVGSVALDVVENGAAAVFEAISRCPESIVVVDVVEQKHLAAVAQAVARSEGRWLPVGSAGLAEELPLALDLVHGLPNPAVPIDGPLSRQATSGQPILVVAGSRNEVTAAQIREVFAVLDLPVVEPDPQRLLDTNEGQDEIKRVAETAGQCLAGANCVIITTCFAPRLARGSLDIAVALGQITSQVMSDRLVGGLFLTGGDIALQVCLALRAQALQPLTEVSPGLPVSLLNGGPWDGLRIITKAGGFGEKDAILTGIHYLKGES